MQKKNISQVSTTPHKRTVKTRQDISFTITCFSLYLPINENEPS